MLSIKSRDLLNWCEKQASIAEDRIRKWGGPTALGDNDVEKTAET
jgi:hypothetical protein